jgi:hypothetical protein
VLTPDYAKESVGAGVESGSSDTMLKRRALHLALLLLALHCAAHARKKRVYEHGVLIAVSPLYIDFQRPFDGPLTPIVQIPIEYRFQIQSETLAYLVHVVLCCPPSNPHFKGEWAVNDVIDFRIHKDKMFIKRPNGKESPTTVLKVVPGIAGPSLASRELPAMRGQKTRHRRLMRLGGDLIRVGQTCLMLYGYVEADDFFDGLIAIQTGKGIQFFKGDQEIETFPEGLTINVLGALGTCTDEEYLMRNTSSRKLNLRLDEDFMKSILFDGSWKQGLDEKRAELGPVATGRTRSPDPRINRDDWWSYQLKVRSKEISVNDSLVLTIESPDGDMITRLSGRLLKNLSP